MIIMVYGQINVGRALRTDQMSNSSSSHTRVMPHAHGVERARFKNKRANEFADLGERLVKMHD
jgi:hypothetical protein